MSFHTQHHIALLPSGVGVVVRGNITLPYRHPYHYPNPCYWH
jgi:hypothetical protein